MQTLDLTIRTGDPFAVGLRLDEDPAGYAWAAEMRTSTLPKGTLLATFSVDVTPDPARFEVGFDLTNVLLLELTGAQTAELRTMRGDEAVWDLQAVGAGTVAGGAVTVQRDVTDA